METLSDHPTPRKPASARSLPIAALLLVLAGLLAYSNSFNPPLLLDDSGTVVNNPSIRQLWPLTSVLTPPSDVGLGGRPVANLSFALNYALGGTGVTGYHVVNLGIHLAAALTLFGVVRRTLLLTTIPPLVAAQQATPLAFAIALLWLLHPLHTESVTYISQRTESLMGLLYLLTLYIFIRGATAPPEQQTAWFAGAVVSCTLGMATKEVMVTAPAVLFLFDRIFLAGSFRAAWRERRRVHLALAATWLLLLFLLADVHERGIGFSSISGWEYALTSSRSIVHYLRLALWPGPLVFDYGTGVLRSITEAWTYFLALLVMVTGTAVALWRWPRAGFALAWVLLVLSPTTSVVPVTGQPMAEHRMYLPLVGIVALLATLLTRRFGARTALILPFVAAAAGYATFDRNRDYASGVTLWTDTVEKAPANGRAHAALGAALLEQGQLAPAIAALERAVALSPEIPEAHNNLAMSLVDVGRTSQAVAHFIAALQLHPGVASTHYNFGNALLQLGRTSEAIAQHQQALILQPDFAEADCALGDALAAAGRMDEAIARYQRGVRRKPELVAGHFGLANALARSGRVAEAVPHYEATVRAVPLSFDAQFNLGNAYLALGRSADAIPPYQAAIRLQPDFAPARHNAGNALALAGRLAEAIVQYETALALQPDFAATRANLEALRKAQSGAR